MEYNATTQVWGHTFMNAESLEMMQHEISHCGEHAVGLDPSLNDAAWHDDAMLHFLTWL